MTKSRELEPKKIILATHNEKTILATQRALGLATRDDITGFNPEDSQFKEPESDTPMIPALFKTARLEQLAQFFGIEDYSHILASDVVWSYNNKPKHRPPELRDTTADDDVDFDSATIAILIKMYSESFTSSWDTSFGVSRPKKKHPGEHKRVITVPVRVKADIPALTPEIVMSKLEKKASPGIDIMKLIGEKQIKLAIQSLDSDKVRDISHQHAYQLVVRRSLVNAEMLRRIMGGYDQGPERIGKIDHMGSIPFHEVAMNDVLKWYLKEEVAA